MAKMGRKRLQVATQDFRDSYRIGGEVKSVF